MGQVDDDELVGDWELDPAHTRIGFSARHAMVTKVRGAFNEIDGLLHVDRDGPGRSSVTVRLAVASVDTRHAQRDAHLRSADFFDVERYPDIVFQSTMIDEVEARMYMVVGNLTIRGVTREIAIPIELRGVERGADGELRAGFEGSRRVDRREWGLRWQVGLDAGGVLVSERVTMEFEISSVKSPATPDDTPGAATPRAATPENATPGSDTTSTGESTPPRPDSAEAPASPRAGGRHRAPSGWFSRVWGARG